MRMPASHVSPKLDTTLAINVEGADAMKSWLYRSRRHQQRQAAAHRRTSANPARTSRFELLEDRRLLTATVDTLLSFSGGTGEDHLHQAGLTLVGSKLFGTSGSAGDGTIFSMNTDGSDYTVLHSFADGTTTDPEGSCGVSSLTLANGIL